MRELWHAAGRAAGDPQKRRTALLGVLCCAPALVAGAALSSVLAGHGVGGLGRPLAFVLAPCERAYLAGDDLALLGYLALQGLLVTLVWGWFGGALQRQAAVDLTQGRREESGAAYAFARRHWRGFVGAKAGLFVGTFLPLAVAALVACSARLGGALGGILLAAAIVVAALLAFVGVLLASSWLVAGFLTAPVIACEDSDSFDALGRAFGYAGKGLPRLSLWRLAFLGGVLLGVVWRGLRTLVVVAVGYACLRLGAGAAALEGVERILAALGEPAGAERLDLAWSDYLAAFVAAATLFVLAALWLADALARSACARVAVYLGLRERVDGTPRTHLGTPPAAPAFQDAAAAGFDEVARLGGA